MFFLCSSCRRQSGSPAFSYSEPYSPHKIDAGIHHKTRNYKRQPPCSGCFTLPMGYGLLYSCSHRRALGVSIPLWGMVYIGVVGVMGALGMFQSPSGVWSTLQFYGSHWCRRHRSVSIPLWVWSTLVYDNRRLIEAFVSIPLWVWSTRNGNGSHCLRHWTAV